MQSKKAHYQIATLCPFPFILSISPMLDTRKRRRGAEDEEEKEVETEEKEHDTTLWDPTKAMAKLESYFRTKREIELKSSSLRRAFGSGSRSVRYATNRTPKDGHGRAKSVTEGTDTISFTPAYEPIASEFPEEFKKDVLLFVHGYCNSFNDALQTTAKVADQLQWPGDAICFSWPSVGRYAGYFVDEASNGASVRLFAEYIQELLTEVASKGANLHILAHSMGNRLVLAGLSYWAERQLDISAQAIGQVLFVEADEDRDTFLNTILEVCTLTPRVTVYCNPLDEALKIMSTDIHGYPRAGDMTLENAQDLNNTLRQKGLQHLPQIVVLEAGVVGRYEGHTYYVDVPKAGADMIQVLQKGRSDNWNEKGNNVFLF